MALGKGLSSLIPQKKGFSTPAAPAIKNSERIWYIPLSDIVPNPEQPRKHFSHSDLEDLVNSIKEHGVLQPINVTEREDGGYELIAGERRFRASQVLNLPTIPAIVRVASNAEKLELALIENIQRQNLNPIEEAFAYNRLIQQFGCTQEEVAAKVGKSRSAVANTVRLLDLPEVIQKALVEGVISAGKARALLSIKNEQEQLQVFASMIGESVTVRDVERTASLHRQNSGKGFARRDPNILAQEQMIEERLGARVKITQKGEKGTIVIEYHSKDEFKRLLEELV